MEGLSPSLDCLYFIRRRLAQGYTLRESLTDFVKDHSTEFSASLSIWLNYYESAQIEFLPEIRWSSDYQPILITAFESGLNGRPIEEQLEQLTLEVEVAHRHEVDEFIAKLPLRALTPVFLFQFPAFLLLIFGPVLGQFIRGVTNGL